VGNNDVIIIGAGHNSLVAAGYLAKAGRRVVVFEKRSVVGGSAITEETFPGFKISPVADTAGYLSDEVKADLKLDSQVEFIPLDPIASSPEPDGTHLTIWRDTARTVKEIERFSPADAAKYPLFVERMTKIAGVVKGLLEMTPIDLPSVGFADLRAALGLAGPLFKLGRTKGPLALEQHLENPEESAVFQAFPRIAGDHHAMTFITDYLRLLTLGTDNPHELETLIDEEIETHHHEQTKISGAIQEVADALPALGIVAAVLGVIKTMGSITEPPEVLGKLIGGALVGTFLGVFVAYGFVGPLASSLKATYEAEGKYYECIKAGLLAYLAGHAPQVCIEFARKALLTDVRPSFYELEDAVSALSAPA